MKRLLVGLLLSASAWAIDLSVQWATTEPAGFVTFSNWRNLPTRPDPAPNAALDDQPGWVNAIRIGAHIVAGCDHYSITQRPLASYCWRDEHWYGVRGVEVCRYDALDFQSAETASAVRGRALPRCTYYGDFMMKDNLSSGNSGLVLVRGRPLGECVPPRVTIRHGKYMPPERFRQSTSFWSVQ